MPPDVQTLQKRIRDAFTSGFNLVWQRCRELRAELIHDHVIDGKPLDPYYSVIDHIQDVVRVSDTSAHAITGDWTEAVKCAYELTRVHSWDTIAIRERVHARIFEVAKAARRLKAAGYDLSRSDHLLSLDAASEAKLIAYVDELVAKMGGLRVARRIFRAISNTYDASQERYQVVPHPQPTGEGQPQIPFGYLVQLAAKHASRPSELCDTERNWLRLQGLTTDYAVIFDVQNYSHTLISNTATDQLLPLIEAIALADTLFRIPQIRGSDVVKVAVGVLSPLDFDERHGSGWSIREVLAVIESLLTLLRDWRGPRRITPRATKAGSTFLSREQVAMIYEEMLSHGEAGANQRFSKPTDAPMSGVRTADQTGQDFFIRPLLRYGAEEFFLLDRSVCAPACLEALFAGLRRQISHLDDQIIGPAVERFLRNELRSHGVSAISGKYDANGKRWQCDLVVETPKAVVFIEVKKKALTRPAKAGSRAHILLDLAKSLVEAQLQAGRHEIQLRKMGCLELNDSGNLRRVELRNRGVERIAVSLHEFGSFQDRVFLKQMLESTLGAQFGVNDAALQDDFNALNMCLTELRTQVEVLNPTQGQVAQPFFHCWFLSVPQFLVLLDGVQDADSFQKELWLTRHVVMGTRDFYHDIAHVRGWQAKIQSTGKM